LSNVYDNENALSLGYSIIQEYGFSEQSGISYDKLTLSRDEKNLKILSDDKKLLKLLHEVKVRFDNSFHLLIKANE